MKKKFVSRAGAFSMALVMMGSVLSVPAFAAAPTPITESVYTFTPEHWVVAPGETVELYVSAAVGEYEGLSIGLVDPDGVGTGAEISAPEKVDAITNGAEFNSNGLFGYAKAKVESADQKLVKWTLTVPDDYTENKIDIYANGDSEIVTKTSDTAPKETDTTFRATTKVFTIYVGEKETVDGDELTFEATSDTEGKLVIKPEELAGGKSSYEYSLDDGKTWIDVETDADGSALVDLDKIANNTNTQEIQVRQKEYVDETTPENSKAASAIAYIDIKTQEAPADLEGTVGADNKGAITGMTDAMEYRLLGEDGKPTGEWLQVDAISPVTGIVPGTYVVRYKADGDKLASPASDPVTIEAKAETVLPMKPDGSAPIDITVGEETRPMEIGDVVTFQGSTTVDEAGTLHVGATMTTGTDTTQNVPAPGDYKYFKVKLNEDGTTATDPETGKPIPDGDPTDFTVPAAGGFDINLTDLKPGDKIAIVKKGNDSTTADSKAEVYEIPYATEPTGVSAEDCQASRNNDGKLTSTEAAGTVEYRKAGDPTWTAIDGTEVTNLEPGDYEVRTKQTTAALASKPVPLTIGKTARIKVTKFDCNGDGSVRLTDVVSVFDVFSKEVALEDSDATPAENAKRKEFILTLTANGYENGNGNEKVALGEVVTAFDQYAGAAATYKVNLAESLKSLYTIFGANPDSVVGEDVTD